MCDETPSAILLDQSIQSSLHQLNFSFAKDLFASLGPGEIIKPIPIPSHLVPSFTKEMDTIAALLEEHLFRSVFIELTFLDHSTMEFISIYRGDADTHECFCKVFTENYEGEGETTSQGPILPSPALYLSPYWLTHYSNGETRKQPQAQPRELKALIYKREPMLQKVATSVELMRAYIQTCHSRFRESFSSRYDESSLSDLLILPFPHVGSYVAESGPRAIHPGGAVFALGTFDSNCTEKKLEETAIKLSWRFTTQLTTFDYGEWARVERERDQLKEAERLRGNIHHELQRKLGWNELYLAKAIDIHADSSDEAALCLRAALAHTKKLRTVSSSFVTDIQPISDKVRADALLQCATTVALAEIRDHLTMLIALEQTPRYLLQRGVQVNALLRWIARIIDQLGGVSDHHKGPEVDRLTVAIGNLVENAIYYDGKYAGHIGERAESVREPTLQVSVEEGVLTISSEGSISEEIASSAWKRSHGQCTGLVGTGSTRFRQNKGSQSAQQLFESLGFRVRLDAAGPPRVAHRVVWDGGIHE